MKRTVLSLLLTAAAASAQPTMPVSPIQGNPADLRIQMPSGASYYNFQIKIGLDCSFVLSGGLILMDTGQNGIIGSGGSVGSACQIDLGVSQLLSDGYLLRIQKFGTVLGTYDVVADYTEYGGQYYVTTIGQWAAGPPIVAPTITSPIPGSTLPLGGAFFTWTAGSSGITSYGLRAGTNPGAADLFNLSSTSSLSAYVNNLPSTGGPVYISLLWVHPVSGAWQTNSFTYTSGMVIAPPQIVSPAPGTVITTPTVTVTWNDSATAENTWTQIGTTAGGGELSQYQTFADTTKVVNVPVASDPFVWVNLSAQATGVPNGWLSTSAVYATPVAAGATPPRASKLQAPVAGTVLSGITYFQWDWGNGALDYRLEVGTAPGMANILNGAASTNSAVYANIPATGGLIYATVYTRFASGTLAETAVYTTQSLGQNAPYQPTPAQVISIARTPANPQTATVQWNSGVGVDCYWLSLGTAPNTTNLFDQSGECTTQRGATVPTLTTTGATLQPTLYSRSNNVWYPTSSLPVPTESLPDAYATFKQCISATGTGSVCTLPAGTHLIGPGEKDGLRIERGGTATNPLIVQGGSAILGRSASRLVRTNPVRARGDADPGEGCGPLIQLAGVSNIVIRNLIVDGGGLAFPIHCTKTSSATPPSSGEEQPSARDMEIGSTFTQATSNIVIDNVRFQHSIGRALTIHNANTVGHREQVISGVTVRNCDFIGAQRTGILVGQNFAYDDWRLPGGAHYAGPLLPEASADGRGCNAPGASRAGGVSTGPYSLTVAQDAAEFARIPRDIVVENCIFQRQWTGAIALNVSYNARIGSNTFIDNYTERSWDGGGGTVYEDNCSLGNKWFSNSFNNSGTPLVVETSAFEMYGRYTEIYDNEIYNQPEGGIVLFSTLFSEVKNNKVYDASLKTKGTTNPDYAPVRIANVSDERKTHDVKFFGNDVRNTDPTLKHARYGVHIGGCINGLNCSSELDYIRIHPPAVAPANFFLHIRKQVPMCSEAGTLFVGVAAPPTDVLSICAHNDNP